jgi:hypothetical protein
MRSKLNIKSAYCWIYYTTLYYNITHGQQFLISEWFREVLDKISDGLTLQHKTESA